MDIFSRYVWLRILNSKNSREIALILKEIYDEHSKPDIFQMDNGKKFKGKVFNLCKKSVDHITRRHKQKLREFTDHCTVK